MNEQPKLDTPCESKKRENKENYSPVSKKQRGIIISNSKYYLQKYLKYKSKYLDLQAEMKKLSLI